VIFEKTNMDRRQKMRRLISWRRVICVMFVSWLIFISCASHAEENISLEVIKSGLKIQEELSKPGLLVKYSFFVQENGNLQKLTNKCTYIRTQDMLFYEDERWKDGQSINVQQCQYNRKENNYKILEINKRTGKYSGLIGSGLPELFTVPNIVDPVLFSTGGDFLYDLIKNKNVRVIGMEQVERYKCCLLKGSITRSPYVQDNISIWIDPEIGFCPRQIKLERIFSEIKVISIIKFGDYKEITKGVWLPYYIENNTTNYNVKTNKANEEVINIMKVEEASAAKPISNKIVVEFPSDCPYYDKNIKQMIYPPKK